MVFQAIVAGASGYLLKGPDGNDIVAAIHSSAQGQAVFGAALAKRLQTWFGRPPKKANPFPKLTNRERDILDGVAAGMSNAEIGATLFLSPKTVANDVSRILDKLHLAHRADAIVKARHAGLGQDRQVHDTRDTCKPGQQAADRLTIRSMDPGP